MQMFHDAWRGVVGRFSSIAKEKHLLTPVCIFLFALILRLSIVTTGFPYMNYWDEPTYLWLTFEMMEKGDFDHKWYKIPPFFLYQHVGVQSIRTLNEAKDRAVKIPNTSQLDRINRDMSDVSILLWSRGYTAILGALSCLLLYLIVRILYDEHIAIMSGLILSIVHGHIEHSILMTADMPMAFLLLWVVFLCLIWDQLSPLRSFWIGIFCGLVVASKYNGVFIVITPILYILFRHPSNRIIWLLQLAIGCLAGFTFGYPYWIAKFPQFLNGFAEEVHHYNIMTANTDDTHKYGFVFLRYLFVTGLGPLVSVMVLLGLPNAIRRFNDRRLIFFTFPAAYCVWLLTQQTGFSRNTIPLFPWFAVLASIGFAQLWSFLKRRLLVNRSRVLQLPFIGILVIGVALAPAIWIFRMAMSTETRVRMVDETLESTKLHNVVAIPDSLHFVNGELKRLNRPVIFLHDQTFFQQSLLGIDYLIAGAKPKPEQDFTLLQSSAHTIREIIQKPVYAPWSSLGMFDEGKWHLNGYSVNPDLLLMKVENHESWKFIDARDETNTIRDFQSAHAESLSASRDDKRIRVGRLSYDFGFYSNMGTLYEFVAPKEASRFLVDLGLKNTHAGVPKAEYWFVIKTNSGIEYMDRIPKNLSTVRRIEIPVNPGATVTLQFLGKSETGNANVALGYCGFIFPQAVGEGNS